MRLGALVPERTPDDVLKQIQLLSLSATGVSLPAEGSLDQSSIEALRERFRNAGVQISQVGCYTNLECEPGAVRDRLFAKLGQVIQLAGAVGARCVVSGVGHMDPQRREEVFAAHPDNWTDRAMDRLAESCTEAAAIAYEANTLFCVESWVITTLDSPRRLGELVRRVGTRGFGILLDPVNLMSLNTYFENGRLIRECFEEAGDAIRLVHAKDTKLVESSFTYHMSEVPPGEGILDYGELLACTNGLTDSDTPLLIEHLKDYGQIERARDYIKSVAGRSGISFSA